MASVGSGDLGREMHHDHRRVAAARFALASSCGLETADQAPGRD
jgi:hypothetical protein